jgi:hypothetical protein
MTYLCLPKGKGACPLRRKRFAIELEEEFPPARIFASATTRQTPKQSQGEQMDIAEIAHDSMRYAKCIEAAKRVRWDIDADVIRERQFDFSKKFLPDGLSHVEKLKFLNAAERRFLSQIQGRTYANMFCLVERFIGAKMLEISRRHWFGDPVALEALVRFSDEELKHQALFRRIEAMIAADMEPGYTFASEPNAVAGAVMAASTWAVLALTCHIELFTQVHYRQSIEKDADLCEIYKDVFLYHWREESQHAIVDELEWLSEDQRLTEAQRDKSVGELIGLVMAVDRIVQAQAKADAEYFEDICAREFSAAESAEIARVILGAYRWQYIVSGVQEPRFSGLLGKMINEEQSKRIGEALAPVMQ